MLKIISLLLFSSLAFGQQVPVRPTYQDVSLKVIEPNGDEAYKWYHGHTANQIERDAMENVLYTSGVPEAIRFVRDISACNQATSFALSNWTKITAKLGGGYEDNSLLSGVWSLDTQGRHYSFERYALIKIRDCLVSTKVAPICAASPLMTKDFADLLDIRVVNGQCVKGATDFSVTPPMEPFNAAVGESYPVQRKIPQPVLTQAQTDQLMATHMAHKAIADWKCNGGPKPTADPLAEHLKFEAMATSPSQMHFFMMKKFSGFQDPKLPPDQMCKWQRLADFYHEAWMNAVLAGDWRVSRMHENNHCLSHLCANLHDSRYKVQFSCGAKRVLDCPTMTCDEYLASLGM